MDILMVERKSWAESLDMYLLSWRNEIRALVDAFGLIERPAASVSITGWFMKHRLGLESASFRQSMHWPVEERKCVARSAHEVQLNCEVPEHTLQLGWHFPQMREESANHPCSHASRHELSCAIYSGSRHCKQLVGPLAVQDWQVEWHGMH